MKSGTTKRVRTRSVNFPKICIAATGTTINELMVCARRALAHSPFVELRLDWLTRPSDAIPQIANLIASSPGAILQATCRREPNGGRFSGTVDEQLRLLISAAEAGCRLIDVEIESAEAAQSSTAGDLLEALRKKAAVILSFHDFKKTPPLGPVVSRLRKIPANIYKIVPTAKGQSDVVRLLNELQEQAKVNDAQWVGFCMGDAGIPSRVLALSRGSAFIYAAPPAAEESFVAAPGQVDAELLRRRYRADKLSSKTKLYGVLGNPVKHSIGTAVHNTSISALGLDAVYLPLQSDDVREFRQAALDYPLAGFSITLPHKQAILRYIDSPDKVVQAVGAANTVRVRRGKWEAINSDVAGIIEPLKVRYELTEKQKLPADFSAIVLGNGGAARAAIVGLRSLGCRRILIAGRNPLNVGKLAKEFRCGEIALKDLGDAKADLLIQATSVGMWPQRDESPLTPVQICAETVFDLIYNPHDTKLLRMARAKGCQTISGIEMYLAQAARQFEYWTGLEAPLARMRRTAAEELDRMRQQQNK